MKNVLKWLYDIRLKGVFYFVNNLKPPFIFIPDGLLICQVFFHGVTFHIHLQNMDVG